MKVKRKSNHGYPFPSSYKDSDSVLKILPVTVLALAFSLPNNDRDVLAYLLARSMLTTINGAASGENKCKTVKKKPLFECGCFDCYTSFWYRWDSSPNRELIHQVIEAFEEHLLHNDVPKKVNRCKKRGSCNKVIMASVIAVNRQEFEEVVTPEKEVVCEELNEEADLEMEVVTVQSQSMGAAAAAAKAKHKGLARKVLPDVVGLLNSRLWSFWSPGA